MKRIIAILLLSVGVTAGAAACGASNITLDEAIGTAAASQAATSDAVASDTEAATADAKASGTEDDLSQTGETTRETPVGDELQEMLCVYVCGEVMTPGVYQLPAGARIYEALELAGGLTDEADVSVVNQALELSDGMMVRVPVIGEIAASDPVQTTDGTISTSAQTSSSLVNINTADAATLMTLPGIGESKAAAILAYRERHGSFASKEELLNVSGIGDATYSNLESRIVAR